MVGLLVYVRGNGDQEGSLDVVAHRAHVKIPFQEFQHA